jgi:ABC-2 type transport system permease protein
MSASVASTTAGARRVAGVARPSFPGLLRGELFKIAHMRIVWVMAALYAAAVVVVQLIWISNPQLRAQVHGDAFGTMLTFMEGDLSVVRVLGGIFTLILAAHVIGLEYQQGTIRILLGRGVGRLQALGAKVLAAAVVSLLVLALGLAIEVALGGGLTLAVVGSRDLFKALPSEFWRDVGLYALCVLISMAATLLLGVAASVVGRSLAFGLAAGLSWFAVDNMGVIVMNLAYGFTHADFWRNVTGLFLGPLLNRLPNYLIPARQIVAQGPHGPVTSSAPVDGFGILPLVGVSGGHALAVIAAYAAIFAVAAVALTWRRDVLE